MDINGQTGLFESQPNRKSGICPRCGNRGYTGCAEAIDPKTGGDFITIAWQKGTACTCAAGAEFARQQMEWMK